MLRIVSASKSDYDEIMQIWESAVRMTHHFLSEEHLQELKPLIRNVYLDAVELFVAKDEKDCIVGFLGVADGKVEMLFVSPANFRTGMGKLLMEFAIKELGITAVDVNEQNQGAYEFYASLGFRIIGHSPKDGQGWAYPILHLIC